MDQLNETLTKVEDEFSGVSINPMPGTTPDGRMYPAMDDMIVRGPDGSITATSRGHVTHIAPDGTLKVVDKKSGEFIHSKRRGGQ